MTATNLSITATTATGNDALVGGEGNDTLSGLGGADTLTGLLGHDSLLGGEGDDVLDGGDGDDTLLGGEDGDTLTGGAGLDVLYGGEGRDTLYDTGVSWLFGEGGDDVLTVTSVEGGGRTYGLWMDGGEGNDLIAAPTLYRAYGGAGDDVIQMSAMQPIAPDMVDGGEGTDELRLSWYGWSGLNIDFSKVLNFELINFTDGNGGGLRAVLSDVTAVAGMTLQIRTSGSGHGIHVDGSAELDAHLDMRGVDSYSPNDTLIGGQLSDTMSGLGGNDVLSGQAGDDWLLGGAGDDTLTGGQGDDTLDGGDGFDTAVFSGNYADYIVTEIVSTASAAGYLEVSGVEGTDRLYGVNRLMFADQTVEVTVPGLLLVGSADGDVLLAGEGDDTVQGLEGADTLTGLLGHDSLLGGEGDDVLDGGDGDDTLLGGEDGDTLTGGAGLDVLYGGEGRDTLYDTGVSWLFGEGGDDVLTVTSVEGGGRTYGLWMDGGEGNDLIAAPTLYRAYGGAGDDVIQMSAMQPIAPDMVDGGEGTDELRLSWYGWSGLNIDFSKVLNFELINFTDGNGGGLRAVLSDVTAVAGMTLQIRTSGSGHGIHVDGSAELDAHLDMRGVDSYSPNDTLIGGQLSDTMSGLGGNDVLSGQAGDDWLLGGAGDDTLTGGQGDDTLDGGDGFDTAVFSGNYADYVVNEGIGSLTIVGADGSDVLRNMNRLVFADQVVDLVIAGIYLEGTEESDLLVGGDGDDAISGLDGDDSILGGDGNDILDGGLGNDSLYAGAGDDSVEAGDGDDLIVGGDGAGDDTYVGGSGIDTIRYTSAVTGIVVDLSTGIARGNEIGADQIQGIENIIGGQAADRLIGRHDANEIDGYWGDDTIIGGGGTDLLTGGTGNDLFLFHSAAESIFNSDVISYDTITDFSDGDQIQWLGLAGLSTTMSAYAWSTDLASTIAAIRSDRDVSNQVIFFTDQTDGYFYIHGVGTGSDFDGSLVKLLGVRSVPESMSIPGVTVRSPEIIQQDQDSIDIVNNEAPTFTLQQPRPFSGDPSLGLHYEIMDHTPNAVIFGTDSNDFIYLGGTGNKAVNGGGGNDVIDGGTGSSFMTGGGSGDTDTFFLDGRAPGITWSTITDFEMGLDRVTIWGWKEGISRVAFIDEQGGAAGFTGLTLHFENLLPDHSEVGAKNLNFNSITFSEMGLEDLGIVSLEQINHTISEKISSHFLVGQTMDVYGEHGYLQII